MTPEFRLNLEVASGNLPAVDWLLNGGVCVDGSDNLPTRPLVLAAEMGRIDVLEMLIGRGANLEAAVPQQTLNEYGVAVIPLGSRALHAAVIGDKVSSVRCLLKAGAKPDVINTEGWSPLMLAYRSPEIVAELLKGGACPTFANSDGAIALHLHAVNYAPHEAMRLLVEAAPSTPNQVGPSRYVSGTAAVLRTLWTQLRRCLVGLESQKAGLTQLCCSSLLTVLTCHESLFTSAITSATLLSLMLRERATRQQSRSC